MEEVMEAITHENMVTPVTYQHTSSRSNTLSRFDNQVTPGSMM